VVAYYVVLNACNAHSGILCSAGFIGCTLQDQCLDWLDPVWIHTVCCTNDLHWRQNSLNHHESAFTGAAKHAGRSDDSSAFFNETVSQHSPDVMARQQLVVMHQADLCRGMLTWVAVLLHVLHCCATLSAQHHVRVLLHTWTYDTNAMGHQLICCSAGPSAGTMGRVYCQLCNCYFQQQ
jgi:hypothetical protein